jgi:methylated-DNA-[protein]-cysteine S-methyltransferase
MRIATIYKTGLGDGILIWENGFLAAHYLPGTRAAPSGGLRPHPNGDRLQQRLEEYFRGERVAFPPEDLPIDWQSLSDFALRIFQALTRVPYGETVSYAGLAVAAGHPGAQRAVGSLMARNPLPLLIPCHRVIRGDGRIGNYSAGTGWKLRLLTLERALPLPRRA